MSDLTNTIVLRPRFEISLEIDPEGVKRTFDTLTEDRFITKRIDEHIYIRFKKEDTTFWSPQLHLEIVSFEANNSVVHGVYGPNPTLWTFFMFLHFGIATVFLILGAFAYSKHALNHDITPYGIGMVLLIILWFVLYAFGRFGRHKGKSQMHELQIFADAIISQIIEQNKTRL